MNSDLKRRVLKQSSESCGTVRREEGCGHVSGAADIDTVIDSPVRSPIDVERQYVTHIFYDLCPTPVPDRCRRFAARYAAN